MIICAAVKIIANNQAGSNEIVCGRRHGDCYRIIKHFSDFWLHSKKIEGFLTHDDKFLTREEALQHAFQCGQLSQTARWTIEDQLREELESEDLW